MADRILPRLLHEARARVHARICGTAAPRLPIDPELRRESGAFVTLWVRGQLRGCMGSLDPDGPLVALVARMAEAALRDPRFADQPLEPRELGDLRIEVSVLSRLRAVRGPQDVVVGQDGVVVETGGKSGCFLPKVCVERGWSAEETLDQLCRHKLGLLAGAWRLPGARIYTFTAESLIESEPPAPAS
jgi:AmmeMemoRadiSam system protein A